MSKRKHKTEPKDKNAVHQPDDKLFKEVMERKESPAQYLKTYYQELAEVVDLSSFKIVREKFSIPNLKTFDADVLYRCRLKDSDETLLLSFLWENKSQPEKYVSIQMGLYLFLRYYKMVKTKGMTLEPIIPLLFYNGKEDWIPKTLPQLFESHPLYKIIEWAIPKFNFHFTDITKVPKEELLNIEMAFFKSAMIAMANRHDYDLLLQNFSIIFDLDDEDELISISYFVFSIYERLPEEVKKDISPLAVKIQNKIMSTLARFEQRGMKKRDTQIIQNMFEDGFSISKIASALRVDEKFVEEVIKNMKK